MFDIDAFTQTLRINECAKVYCEKDWSWNTQASGLFHDFDLWTVLEGKGVLTCDEGRIPLHAGTCFLLRPYGRYNAVQDIGDPLTVVFIHFTSRFPDGAEQSLSLCRDILHFDHFAYLLENIVTSYTRKAVYEALCWLRVALMEVYAQNCLTAQNLLLPAHRQCINQICVNVRKYPGQPHRLYQYARDYNYSSDHLGRIFKAHIGIPFSRFVARVRIDQAKFMLRTSDISVSRIADRLAFSDSSFFIRQFQKYENTTPLRYRNSCVRKER